MAFSYVETASGRRKAIPEPLANTLQHALDVNGSATVIIKGVTEQVTRVVIKSKATEPKHKPMPPVWYNK